MMKNRLLLTLIVVSFLIGSNACTRRAERETTKNEVKTQLGTQSTNTKERSGANAIEVPEDVIASANAQPKPVKHTQTLHVFIENSGSMNGYINNASDFQVAIGDALQYMQMSKKPKYDTIKTYYINQNVKEQVMKEGEDIYSFVQKMLSRKDFTTSGTGKKDSGTAYTNLNEIIRTVLSKVDENNTAILISDCIYSVGKGTQTSALLAGCRSLTMRHFAEAAERLTPIFLATNVVQMYSLFDGNYWTWDKPTGSQYAKLKCFRPYYICIMGTDDNVKAFNKSIRIEQLKGYANQFTISNKDVSKAKYTVFDTKYKKGTYRHERNDSEIHDITRVAKNSVGEFELGIGIDLSDFSMSETDKLDVANYIVESGNYIINRIETIDTTKLTSPFDKKLVKYNKCTHVIVLSATGFPNDFSISIKRNLPQWIHNTSSLDDSNISMDEQEQRKTFGIEYFVEGISKAYQYLAEDENNFMTINVKVKK